MILDIITGKIKKTQFTHCGCGNLTEYDSVKELVKSMLEMAKSGTLVTIKHLTRAIQKAGKTFAQNAQGEYQDELYRHFVGDFWELFAEFFFKTCSTAGQYGVVDYKPAINTDDWGVDGYGTASDERESSGGKTPAVVQCKFRSNPMDQISYTCLAKTGFDGIKNYGLDITRKHNVVLFCNSANGANYLAQEALGDNLFVIDMRKLDKDQTGIKTVRFWEDFYASVI